MYAKVENGRVVQYPYTFTQLRSDNPNTSFPIVMSEESMAEYGMVRVVATGMPVCDPATQGVREITPLLVDGVGRQNWEVYALSAEEVAEKSAQQARVVRSERDGLLRDSDWTQVADAPVDKAAWAAYRQALRDVTAQAGFPWEVTWPVAP